MVQAEPDAPPVPWIALIFWLLGVPVALGLAALLARWEVSPVAPLAGLLYYWEGMKFVEPKAKRRLPWLAGVATVLALIATLSLERGEQWLSSLGNWAAVMSWLAFFAATAGFFCLAVLTPVIRQPSKPDSETKV